MILWSGTNIDLPQGQSYSESMPSTIDYQCDVPLNMGIQPQTKIEIFANDEPRAPMHLTKNTRRIAVLTLQPSAISSSVKSRASIQRMGGFRYYSIAGTIEARYGSALVSYRARLGGKMRSDVDLSPSAIADTR